MSNYMKNIEEEWITGDPAKIEKNGQCVYGRFYEEDINSAYYDGKHSVVFFLTPGGSKVRVGRAYLQKLDNDDQKELEFYENIQKRMENYTSLYNNEMVYYKNAWVKNNPVNFKTDEMEYTEEIDGIRLKFKKKVLPGEKLFGEPISSDVIDDETVREMLNNVLNYLTDDYTVLYTNVDENINIKLEKLTNNHMIQAFVTAFSKEIRNYYEKHETHITRMFGSYILLSKVDGVLKAIKATPIPIKYCPLMKKLLTEVGGETAEMLLNSLSKDEIDQEKLMCNLINEVVIKGGYFDSDRPLNSCEANVLFGASEMMSSAFKSDLLDAAVIVSNNLGTIITTNDSNTQGAVKRMTGLFYTSPSATVMKTAYEAGIIPVFPYTAEINQLIGVKKAINLGYKKIAVSLATNDNILHEKLKALEKENNTTIYKFGLCSTGISDETATVMGNDADIIWSCASKAVKEKIEPNALAQVGLKIPVHVMTKNGWILVKNHLMQMNNDVDYDNVEILKGQDKPIFVNDNNKIKVLKRKQLGECSDCPHPCI